MNSCSVKDVPQNADKVLKLLRLEHMQDGVFLRLNQTTLALLQIVDPYITWGHPNLRIVKDLIYKKGMGRVRGKRMSLTDNKVIENSLGKSAAWVRLTQSMCASISMWT